MGNALGSWVVKEVQHSCVFPMDDEPRREIVSAIRKDICPNYVPLWVAMLYVTPSMGEHVCKYHVIGTWQPYVSDDKTEPVKAARPSDFPFRGGVVYAQRPWSLDWPKGSIEAMTNVPGASRPFDWDVYDFMRRVYWENGIPLGTMAAGDFGGAGKEYAKARKRRREAERKTLEGVQDDARLRLRYHAREVLDGLEDAKRAIEQGKPWGVKMVDAKPFVDRPEPPAGS